MTDINISGFAEWLAIRKYKPNTISAYSHPLRIAAEKGLMFADIECLDADDCYRAIYSKPAPRHTARAMFQAVRSYREYLDREVSA